MVQANADAANTITDALAKTGVAFSDSAGINTAGFVDDATASYNGVPKTVMQGSSAVANSINPEANLSMTQAVGEDTQAVASNPQSTNQAQFAGAHTSAPGQVPAESTGPPAPAPASDASGGQVPPLKNAMDVNIASPGTQPPPGGGFWDKVGKFADTKAGAAAIQGAGSAIGGLGQGMMQQAAMDKQLAFLREPNASFGGPAAGGVSTASQAPITVPNGYLQRAQALKTMLGSNGAGAVPSASSPVPVWGMGSTPRGGQPGG
jgi:hypothetical protein